MKNDRDSCLWLLYAFTGYSPWSGRVVRAPGRASNNLVLQPTATTNCRRAVYPVGSASSRRPCAVGSRLGASVPAMSLQGSDALDIRDLLDEQILKTEAKSQVAELLRILGAYCFSSRAWLAWSQCNAIVENPSCAALASRRSASVRSTPAYF